MRCRRVDAFRGWTLEKAEVLKEGRPACRSETTAAHPSRLHPKTTTSVVYETQRSLSKLQSCGCWMPHCISPRLTSLS